MKRLLIALLFAVTPLFAGEPSPVEDNNFLAESGRNRDDAVLQYTTFFLAGRKAAAYELTQEWAASSAKHQLGYTIPLYSDGATGLGDATLSYRYQLVGDAASRVAIAPRVSLILPTRSTHFGEASIGVQVNVPLSATLTRRLSLHTNAGATWFRERGEKEINLAQSVAFELSSRVSLSIDGAYTRGSGAQLLVVRPGVQFALDGPGPTRIVPGVAMPLGTNSVLLYVGVEHALR